MKNIGAYAAKTHLAELLNEIEAGAEIAITRRGVPVAMLVPYKKNNADPVKVIAELRKWRKGITWGAGMNTKKAIAEGRR